MSDALQLPAREDARVIWVFTAALEPSAFEVFARPGETWPLADALGLSGLAPGGVETFLAGDLQEYGLARYLAEAHGMDPDSVTPDAARLDALQGPIVLLFTRGVPDGAERLDPKPPLAFQGRYEAPYSLAPTAAPHVPTQSTRGHLNVQDGPVSNPVSLRKPLFITLGVLVLLALVILAFV